MKILRICFKMALFISSYIPLFIIILIQEMSDLTLKSLVLVYRTNKPFWIGILALSIISLISLTIFFSGNYTKRQTFKNAKSINNDILNYFITYIIPLTTINIRQNTSILSNLLIFFIIGVYYIESNLMYINILLIFIGYKVFEDENGKIIITKKSIDDIKIEEDILCKKIGNTKIYITK